ncbi:MAG: hypothetical protein NC212_01820 [Staphylococcus sp.]|nr:hypothetical protein [Staphylococcus sp.]
MTDNNLKGLLNLAYEIEGLLMLRISRGEETSREMNDLLVGKATRLLAGLEAEDLTAETEEPVAVVAPVAAPVAVPAVAEVTAETPAETVEAAEIAESAMEEEAEDAEPDAEIPATINDTLNSETITLDERLARERAADISKAFTINDRFRFLRELFRNSDEEFKETLEVIGSMSSMEEAEDYFFNDLCWDPAKEEVKEFMAIVGKHF